LQACLLNTLEKAKEIGAKSVSIPTLSWHLDYGFSKQDQAKVFIKNCINWLTMNLFRGSSVKLIRLCNISLTHLDMYKRIFFKLYQHLIPE